MSDDRREEYEVARSLEASRQYDAAIRIYMRYGDASEAARVLVGQRRFLEAGKVLIGSLKATLDQFSTLSDAERKVATKAAVCFASGGEPGRSAEILVALGDLVQAIAVLEKAGDSAGAVRLKKQLEAESSRRMAVGTLSRSPGPSGNPKELSDLMTQSIEARDFATAARCAFKLGRPTEAAQFSVRANMFYEAGMSYKAAGELQLALDNLCKVQKSHLKYRAAALQAIALAVQLKRLEFAFDHFIAGFIKVAPQDQREAKSLYYLGRLYEANRMPDVAMEIYRRIVLLEPTFMDVAARLRELESVTSSDAEKLQKIVDEERKFRTQDNVLPEPRASKLPSLPPLEDTNDRSASAGTGFGYYQEASKALRTVVSASEDDRVPLSVAVPASVLEPEPPESMRLGALHVGAVVSDRYEIEKELGRGGMAAVYQAFDRELEETIALKFFFAGEATPDLVKRFKQELTLSRRLSHRNIVGVYDIGSHRGCKYMSMEMLRGETLTSKIAKGLSLVEGLDYLAQACAGLFAAHQQQIVHRDIKPDNLFITTEGVLKVMDFGIAKHQAGPAMTRAGFMAGTPEYIAPEQINNFGKVSHLADVYAIGIVAYEIATGTVPFAHEDLMPLLQMHMMDTPDPPSSRRDGIPPALEMAILKCLKKNPEERVGSCEELGQMFGWIRDELT